MMRIERMEGIYPARALLDDAGAYPNTSNASSTFPNGAETWTP